MRKILLLVFSLFLIAPVFGMQGQRDVWGDLMKRYGDMEKVKPGAWVAYKIHTDGKEGMPETMDWKMSCVGMEKVEGKEGICLETEMEMKPPDEKETTTMIMKMLVVGEPTDEQSVKKMIMQIFLTSMRDGLSKRCVDQNKRKGGMAMHNAMMN